MNFLPISADVLNPFSWNNTMVIISTQIVIKYVIISQKADVNQNI